MKFLIPITFHVETAEQASLVRSHLADTIAAAMSPDFAVGSPEIISDEATVVYTDGGCDAKKGGIGAWAIVATVPGREPHEAFGTELKTTNNRMELTAVIKALEMLEIGPPIVIVSDSEYVVRGITQWCRNWVRNGWKTYDGKPVINRDLWEHVLQLYQLHTVTFKHVKGHSGVAGNERCDQLCKQALYELHKQVLAEAS